MMRKYLVTVIKDVYDETNTGVEIAGLFDTIEKAYEARVKVEKWLEAEGYEDFKVFITHYELNKLAWYSIEENL